MSVTVSLPAYQARQAALNLDAFADWNVWIGWIGWDEEENVTLVFPDQAKLTWHSDERGRFAVITMQVAPPGMRTWSFDAKYVTEQTSPGCQG